MVDLDELTKLLLDKPTEKVYYGRKSGKLTLNAMELLAGEGSKDICIIFDVDGCWKMARKSFREKHIAAFPNAPSSYSYKKWKEIIDKEDLSKEWYHELRSALALPVTKFCEHLSIPEVEASDWLYRQIRNELITLEKHHFERKYSDQVLFSVLLDYEVVTFSILGNAGQTFGIGFYPDDPYGDVYWLVENADYMSVDKLTMNSLIHTLSFYFEKDAVGGDINNPYGKSGHYTSLYISRGDMLNCYLPKSIAVRALSFLEAVNAYLPAFDAKEGNKIEDDHFYDVMLSKDKFSIFDKDLSVVDPNMNPFATMALRPFDRPELDFDKEKSFSATLSVLPQCFNDTSDPERIGYFCYVAALCDNETEEVVAHFLGSGKDHQGLDELAEGLLDKLKGMKVAKKIYVNSFIDEYFFKMLFAPYIDKKKMRLIVTSKDLPTDRAMSMFIKMFEQGNFKKKREAKNNA